MSGLFRVFASASVDLGANEELPNRFEQGRVLSFVDEAVLAGEAAVWRLGAVDDQSGLRRHFAIDVSPSTVRSSRADHQVKVFFIERVQGFLDVGRADDREIDAFLKPAALQPIDEQFFASVKHALVAVGPENPPKPMHFGHYLSL